MTPKHPMQPIVLDPHGTPRFKQNAIVRFLLDAGPFDMNKLAVAPFQREDYEQFAQLIGYSVSGAGDLGYMSPELIGQADEEAAKLRNTGEKFEGTAETREIARLRAILNDVARGICCPYAEDNDGHDEDCAIQEFNDE